MCAEGHRPICQDTGIVNVFLKIGMDVRFEGFCRQHRRRRQRRRAVAPKRSGQQAARLGRQPTRSSNARTPGQHTPAVIQMELVPGNTIDVNVAAKGGGSETRFAMLNPSDSLVDWVLKTVPTMGARLVSSGMLGIGIGGTAERPCCSPNNR